jgi:aminoglycoside phosphotransferase (APT) family kinase protein
VRDALVFALRILEQVGWVLRDRLLGRWLARRDGIPTGIAGVDPSWLTEALQESHPGAVVRRVERLAGHSGTTTRAQVRLEYGARETGAEPPATLFVKITPEDFGTRLFTGVLRLGRNEVGFYRAVRDGLPIPAPRAYCARSARHGARFVLLLEDLAASGCRFPGLKRPVGPEEARAVVRSLGRLHAAFWDSPRLRDELAWLKSHDDNRDASLERWISSRANAPAIARHGDVLSPRVREHAHRIHEHRERLERYWAEGPLTLIHGDSHAGNLYFSGERAGLFDWQVLQRGQGIRDVAYFLVNSLDVAQRRAHEEALVDLYLATLAEDGVRGPGTGRDETWERYRSHALYVWFSASVTAATPGLQPVEVARRAMERCGAALEDLRCFELLDEVARNGGHAHRPAPTTPAERP